MPTPPIIAVVLLCQRSLFGLATKPQRRASARTTGVRASASAKDIAGGSKFETLRDTMLRIKGDELKSYSIKAAKARRNSSG
jgi:hypothetical protein